MIKRRARARHRLRQGGAGRPRGRLYVSRAIGGRRRLWLLRRLDAMVLPGVGGLAFLGGWGEISRWRRQILTVFILIITTVIVAAVALAGERAVPRTTVLEAGQAVQIGMAQGQSVSAYLSASQDELKTMLDGGGNAAETYALVSLKTYLAPGRLTRVLDGVRVVEVFMRLQLSEVRTEIVRIPVRRLPDDLLTGMRQAAMANQAEADEYRALAAALTGASAADDLLRETYLDSAEAASAEAAAFLSHCSCVYAAVVSTTSRGLDRIAARPEVRAVDPAPEVLRLEQAQFVAPLPEQQDYSPANPAASGPG